MEVTVKDGKDELNKALKQFNKMVKKSEIMQELKNREHFLKPSKKRKFKSEEAFRRKKREERRLARQKKYDN
jgi:small subunit ribosomal protein S21